MASEIFRIIYDNPSNIYYAGQIVSGRVELGLTEPKKMTGIIIQIKGEADVKWTQHEHKSNTTYKGNEKYLQEEHYCVGGKNDESFMLPSGNYTYYFSHQIPVTAPASFDGKYGKICYSVKAIIVRQWIWNEDVEKPFEVVSYYDLNRFPNLSKSGKVNAEKYFCCWCCRNGPLTVAMVVPRTGFVNGEKIPVIAEVDNASNVNIGEMCLIFRRVTHFFSTQPHVKYRKNSQVLNEIKLGPVNAHSSKSFTNELVIPKVKTTSLGKCSIIESDYQVLLKAVTGIGHINLKSSIIIVIGNVPFSNQASCPAEHFYGDVQTEIGSGQNESRSNTTGTENDQQVSEYLLQQTNRI